MPYDQLDASVATAPVHQPYAAQVRPELPAAVLWDMDGTLIDSEPYWIAEEFALVESFGGTWSLEHAHRLVGGSLLASAAYIIKNTPVDLEPLEVVDRLMSGVVTRIAEVVPWRPGARELLFALGDAGVPCALVTMSWEPLSDAMLAALPAGVFAAVVTGDSVEQGKPHPEPYLAAAAALGVLAPDCVAIEDSLNGVRSAHASGARTILVPNVVDVTPPEGVVIVPTLDGVAPTDLLAIFGR